MPDNKYDIFISYRRQGGAQYARILQLMLSQRGYKAFLDYDELRDGTFDEKIKKALHEAPVYMLVLSKGSLDRCTLENDWVRAEISYAVLLKKEIIQINPDSSFDGFPQGMPKNLKDYIDSHQFSEINFGSALRASFELMVSNRIVPLIGEPISVRRGDIDNVVANKIQRDKTDISSLLCRIKNLFVKKDQSLSLLEYYVPKNVDYDLFISYRREDGRDHARNIQQALKARGYKQIFFDYDSIQKGDFTKRIIDAIYSCTDFILVLSPKSMKRCTKDGDPVANEIRTAVINR